MSEVIAKFRMPVTVGPIAEISDQLEVIYGNGLRFMQETDEDGTRWMVFFREQK